MSTKGLARIGGLLYLGVAVGGGFSEYVRSSARVPGDAAATAANVASHATLFQIAFATDLADFVLFFGVGLVMYVIFRPVNAPIALAMLVINAVSVAVQALNMLNHAGAMLVATDPHLTAGLSAAGSQAIVLLLLESHRIGYLIAQIFFGLYLLPLGYLVYRSGYFPKSLGAILVAGCAGYVAGVAASFASVGLESSVATYLGLVGGLAEIVFLVWLLVKGANTTGSKSDLIRGGHAWTA